MCGPFPDVGKDYRRYNLVVWQELQGIDRQRLVKWIKGRCFQGCRRVKDVGGLRAAGGENLGYTFLIMSY